MIDFLLQQRVRPMGPLPPDGGPWYAETNLDAFVAEPWNAISSLAFLVPVFYWLVRLRGHYHHYPFLTATIPLLFLGGLGSTLFHAFRRSWFFWALDVFPIIVLTFAVSAYFWYQVAPFRGRARWTFVGVVMVGAIGLRVWLFSYSGLNGMALINAGYFLTGVLIFLPALILLRRTRLMAYGYIVGSTLLFVVALLFRRYDVPYTWMPMGTHWLWHVCGAAGTWLLGEYLYRVAYLSDRPDRVADSVPLPPTPEPRISESRRTATPTRKA